MRRSGYPGRRMNVLVAAVQAIHNVGKEADSVDTSLAFEQMAIDQILCGRIQYVVDISSYDLVIRAECCAFTHRGVRFAKQQFQAGLIHARLTAFAVRLITYTDDYSKFSTRFSSECHGPGKRSESAVDFPAGLGRAANVGEPRYALEGQILLETELEK